MTRAPAPPDEQGWRYRYHGYGGGPRWLACVAALRSPRPLTPNFRSSADTCTETVFWLMNRAVAMSRFDSPATTLAKISRSRAVRPSRAGVESAPIRARRATSAISAVKGAAPSCSASVAAVASSRDAARRSPAARSASARRRLPYASG